MIIKLLTEHHLEFLSLRGCRGSSESTLVKLSNCWKSHAGAHMEIAYAKNNFDKFQNEWRPYEDLLNDTAHINSLPTK